MEKKKICTKNLIYEKKKKRNSYIQICRTSVVNVFVRNVYERRNELKNLDRMRVHSITNMSVTTFCWHEEGGNFETIYVYIL